MYGMASAGSRVRLISMNAVGSLYAAGLSSRSSRTWWPPGGHRAPAGGAQWSPRPPGSRQWLITDQRGSRGR